MKWRVSWNIPESLQFCTYVGQLGGYDLKRESFPVSPNETEWREWWKILLDASEDDPEQDLSHLSPADARAIHLKRFRFYYDAPGFDQLGRFSALQVRCQLLWPDFQKQWSPVGGEKRHLVERLKEPIRQFHPDKLAQQYGRSVTTPVPLAFRLQVNIVRWPEIFHYTVSRHCIVIGAGYLDPSHVESLATLMRTHIITEFANPNEPFSDHK